MAQGSQPGGASRWRRRVARALYWLAVVVVSLVVLVLLIFFLESRDESSLEGAGTLAPSGGRG